MEEVQIENQDGDRDPLLILGKIEDMMLYAYPVLNAYPKYERFVLAADIKRCMDQAMERTIEANKKYYKKTTLQELDVASSFILQKTRRKGIQKNGVFN